MCSSTASSVCVRVINCVVVEGSRTEESVNWRPETSSSSSSSSARIIYFLNADGRGSGNSIKTFLCRCFASLKQIGFPGDDATKSRWGQAWLMRWQKLYNQRADEIQTNKRWVIRIHRARTYLKLNYTTDIIPSRRDKASYSAYLRIAEGLAVEQEHNITTPRTSPILFATRTPGHRVSCSHRSVPLHIIIHKGNWGCGWDGNRNRGRNEGEDKSSTEKKEKFEIKTLLFLCHKFKLNF